MVAQGHAIDQLCDNEYRPSTVIARGVALLQRPSDHMGAGSQAS
jgi:hypothetical protein